MYTPRLFTFCVIAAHGLSVLAQEPTIVWQRTLGGSGTDNILSIAAASDGGCAVVGFSYSSDGDCTGNHNPDNSDVFVAKLDATGGVEWTRMLGSSFEDWGYSISATSDGGYLVGGFAGAEDGDVSGSHDSQDNWLVKLDGDGAIDWQRPLGGTGFDGATYAQEAVDGSIMVAGTTGSNDGDVSGYNGGFDMWVAKLDGTGAIEWQDCFGGTESDQVFAMATATDGSVIAAGYTTSDDGDVSGIHGNSDAWVIKVDASGVLAWQRCLGGNGTDNANGVLLTADGGCLISCYTTSNDGDVSGNHGDYDMWAVKLDADGAIEWQHCLGGTTSDGGYAAVQDADGGYTITGFATSTDGDVTELAGASDVWLVHLDAAGALEWETTYGGTGEDGASALVPKPGGGYFLAAISASDDGDVSGGHGGEDAWVLSLTASTLGVSSFMEQGNADLWFDEAARAIVVSSAEPASTFTLTDAQGRIVINERIVGPTDRIAVDALAAGAYLASVQGNGAVTSQRVVLQ